MIASNTQGPYAPLNIARRMMGAESGADNIANRVDQAQTPDKRIYASEVDAYIRENASTPEEIKEAQWLKGHVSDWASQSFFGKLRYRLVMFFS